MKLQFLVLKNSCKKNVFLWIFIMLLTSLLSLILFVLNMRSTSLNIYSYMAVIGVFTKKGDFAILTFFYQLCFTIYFTFLFGSYEFKNSSEFIFNRCSSLKLILTKIPVLIIAIGGFRLIYSLFWYIFFSNIFAFPIKVIINNILIHIISSLVVLGYIFFLCPKDKLL